MIAEPVLHRLNRATWRGDASRDRSGPGEKQDPGPARAAIPAGSLATQLVVLPPAFVREVSVHTVLRSLLPVEIGYSSNAVQSRRDCPAGAEHTTFVYCTHGVGWAEVAGRRHRFGAGEVLAISPGVPFAYGIDSESWTICWVHVTGINSASFVRELEVTRQNPIRELGDDSQLLLLFQETLHSLDAANRTLPMLVYASQTVAHLLGKMVCLHHKNVRSEADSGKRIKQSIAYMNQHLDKPVHVATLAALANMSASHYTALFKRETGCAPIDYFIRLRMHQARQLLNETNMSVKQVAAELGYDDPFYFSRVFKTINQISPSEYRITRKAGPETFLPKPSCPQLAVA